MGWLLHAYLAVASFDCLVLLLLCRRWRSCSNGQEEAQEEEACQEGPSSRASAGSRRGATAATYHASRHHFECHPLVLYGDASNYSLRGPRVLCRTRNNCLCRTHNNCL